MGATVASGRGQESVTEGDMSEYKGYRIATTVPNFWATTAIANYSIDRPNARGWRLTHEGRVHGMYRTLDDAHSAAEAAARGWIDRHGK